MKVQRPHREPKGKDAYVNFNSIMTGMILTLHYDRNNLEAS